MSRISLINFPSSPKRARVAGAVCAGAVALLALDAGLEWPESQAPQPSPGVARLTPAPESAGFKTLSYYPEQLAALSSLASFTPQASSGSSSGSIDASPEFESVPPPAVSAPMRSDAKTARRIEQPAKSATPASTASATPSAASAEAVDRSAKWFGVAVPGSAAIGDRVAAARDSAAKWGETAWGLGGKVATFWR
jgi:hypothetical protein